MNLVDSSGWLEFFADGPNAEHFAGPIQKIEDVVVPTLCLYEVFKVVLREGSEDEALQVIAVMRQGKVVDLTSKLALEAAKTSLDHKIPMADSIIFATAHAFQATIWTQDEDFSGLPGARFFPKKPAAGL